MKVLLYVDEYCYEYQGKRYFENFGIVLLNRYLAVYEFLKVPVRVKKVSSIEELGVFNKLIDESRVEIVPMPFVQGASDFLHNSLSVKRALKNVTFGCDLAILRHPSVYSFCIQKEVWRQNLPYAVEIVFDCYDGYLISDKKVTKYANLAMHFLQQRACSKAIGVSCVTEHYLQKRYHANGTAIQTNYSSIELPESFYFEPRKYPSDKKFRIVHIAYQVAFNSRKGHNQLIDTLQILHSKGYDVDVYFVGGDYFDGIKKLKEYAASKGIENRVHFCGFLSQPDLRKLLTTVNIAVLPTKAEGLPRVVIEAMAMGLPCISSNVSGNPELLDMNFLLEYQDVEGYANCIENLINNPKLYEDASLENFNRSKKYSASVLNERRTEFYTKIANIVRKKR